MLELHVREARTQSRLALAHYELALFHDNNSREADAIPHYEAALEYGLPADRRADCFAWLASSLYKTGRPTEALDRLRSSQRLTTDTELRRFLTGLERRIRTRTGAK